MTSIIGRIAPQFLGCGIKRFWKVQSLYKLAECCFGIAGQIPRGRFHRGAGMLDCPGHIRFRPPRNTAQRFVDLACGGTAPGLFDDFDRLLCRAGKYFGTAIDYLAVVHMPADAIFDNELVQPVIEPACIVVEPLRECLMERFSNVIDLVPRTVGNKPDDLFLDVRVLRPVVSVRRDEQHLTDDPAHGGRAHADVLPNQRDRIAQVFGRVLVNGYLRGCAAVAVPVRKTLCHSANPLRYRHCVQMGFNRLDRIRGQRQVSLFGLPVLMEARDSLACGSQNQLLG